MMTSTFYGKMDKTVEIFLRWYVAQPDGLKARGVKAVLAAWEKHLAKDDNNEPRRGKQ